MISRWAKVVLPEEEGPAISTTRAPERTVCSAICSMLRSWMASLTRMRSRKSPRSMLSLRSAAFSQLSMPFTRPVSPKVFISFGRSENGDMRMPSVPLPGQRRSSPGR